MPMANFSAARVQELYRHLDHTTYGDTYISWYGQLRAAELSHSDALEATILHFKLRDQPWYKLRMERNL